MAKPAKPSESSPNRANGGSGQLANPYREMASGQLPKTALAKWFETEVHEGGRNDGLARGVGLMAAAGTPRPAAEAAAKWWCRHRCRPPLVGPEVGATFKSIFKAEARKRITEPDDAPDTRGLIVHDMHEFTALDIPPRRHVLRPILPEKGLVMLFAPRGVGKTYVALAMAYAIATAGRFLTWSAPTPRSVLYVDGEMPANEMQDRMRRLVAAHDGAYPDNLRVLSMDMQEARPASTWLPNWTRTWSSRSMPRCSSWITARPLFTPAERTTPRSGTPCNRGCCSSGGQTAPFCLSTMPAAAALQRAAPASVRTCSTPSST